MDSRRCPAGADCFRKSFSRTPPWTTKLFWSGFVVALSFFLFSSPVFAQTTLTPASLSFGNHVVGVASTAKTATFKNTQAVAMTISSITIGGETAPGDYTRGGNCPIIPNTLGAGASCNITVIFNPSALGRRTASAWKPLGQERAQATPPLRGCFLFAIRATRKLFKELGTLDARRVRKVNTVRAAQ